MLRPANTIINKNKIKRIAKKAHHYSKGPFWFLMGFSIAGISIISICIIYFQYAYKDKVIPGVYSRDILLSEKSREEITSYFDKKNQELKDATFTFKYKDIAATASAQSLHLAYDSNLIAEQALSLGKSKNLLTNMFIALTAYVSGIKLETPYTFDEKGFENLLKPLEEKAYKAPVDAQFIMENNKVTTFKNSSNGILLDTDKARKFMKNAIDNIIKSHEITNYSFDIPAIVLKPEITTDKANSFGIVEEVASGTSLFQHSIANRVHNVKLAASRVNGILVKPGEEFSFVKYLGDVSKATGYASAYVIQNGRTVQGDGGGVCQVSTTLFRAVLNAGLPITERHAHAYRVSYYEEDSPPGFDATVYYPSVDFKFVNDTGNYLLIQSTFYPEELRLTYTIYGKKDGRIVDVSKPQVTGFRPAPAPLYQDDPSIPKGVTKQVDWSASGATSTFKRIVKDKNGKVIIDENFVSRYTPWKAVFLVGTG